MASVLNQPFFQDEAAAYTKLESIVWPNGPVCPHCGSTDRMKKMNGAATRPGLHKCYACRKQSRVTVGTVFESSHVPVHMWLQAMYLLCSSKKGISSNQLARTLGVTVKTAWFMSYRLREAMASGVDLPPMGGEGAVVEVDKTLIGTRYRKPKGARGYAHKNAVLTLVERGAGSRQCDACAERPGKYQCIDPALDAVWDALIRNPYNLPRVEPGWYVARCVTPIPFRGTPALLRTLLRTFEIQTDGDVVIDHVEEFEGH